MEIASKYVDAARKIYADVVVNRRQVFDFNNLRIVQRLMGSVGGQLSAFGTAQRLNLAIFAFGAAVGRCVERYGEMVLPIPADVLPPAPVVATTTELPERVEERTATAEVFDPYTAKWRDLRRVAQELGVTDVLSKNRSELEVAVAEILTNG